MITALNVGNNILKRAFAENIDITPMKLQKLIYCVYKEYYKKTQRALFDERFEAWKYGPVLRSVYDSFKYCGANAIKKYHTDSKGEAFCVSEVNSSIFLESLDKVWKKYKNYDGLVLSAFTHAPNTAWRKAIDSKRAYLKDEDILQEEDFFFVQ